jgi:hypothetical protein
VIKTDLDFETAVDNNPTVSCWTLPSCKITLEKITGIHYKINIDKDGVNIFENEKGISFQFHFDYVQRKVSLYFNNGIRGWYLMSEDVWTKNDLNSNLGKIISLRFDMMQRVFGTALNGGDVLPELKDENVKHFYYLKDTNSPSIKELFIVPKKVWNDYGTMTHLNQPDYKLLEDKGVKFSEVGLGMVDINLFSNIEKFMEVRGYGKNTNFEEYAKTYVKETVDEDDDQTGKTPSEPEDYSDLDPSEYYYEVNVDENQTPNSITIVPKKFFDTHKNLLSDHFTIPLEDYLTAGSLMEAIWDVKPGYTKSEIEAEFDAVGYVKNKLT